MIEPHDAATQLHLGAIVEQHGGGQWHTVDDHWHPAGELRQGQRAVGSYLQECMVGLQGLVVCSQLGGVRPSQQVAADPQL
ncbi:MAG: hypothetical protein WCC60_23415, partial [Ilumatobacteraceae bacterium]